MSKYTIRTIYGLTLFLSVVALVTLALAFRPYRSYDACVEEQMVGKPKEAAMEVIDFCAKLHKR